MALRTLIPVLFIGFLQMPAAYAIRVGDAIVRSVQCNTGTKVDERNTVSPGQNLSARALKTGVGAATVTMSSSAESYAESRPPCPFGDTLTVEWVRVEQLSCAIKGSYDALAAEFISDLDLGKNIEAIANGQEVVGIQISSNAAKQKTPCPHGDWFLVRLSKPASTPNQAK